MWIHPLEAITLADCSLSTLARARELRLFRYERTGRDKHGVRYLYELESFEPWARAHYAKHEARRAADRIIGEQAARYMSPRPTPTPTPAPTTPAACGHILAPLCGCGVSKTEH